METTTVSETPEEGQMQEDQQEEIPEQKVLCWTARLWSILIGWLELISNAIGLAFAIFACVLLVTSTQVEMEGPYDPHPHSEIVPTQNSLGISMPILVLSLIRCTIGVFAGVLLLVSVKMGDHIKMRWWIIIETVCLVLISLAALHSFIRVGKSVGSLIEFIIFIISALLVCIVNVHRNELKKLEADEAKAAQEKEGGDANSRNQLEDLDKSLNLDSILFAKEKQDCKRIFHNAARLNRKESLK